MPPLVSNMSPINTLHTLLICFFKIHGNIVLQSVSRSSLQFFRLKFCRLFSSLAYVLYALPVTLIIIGECAIYWFMLYNCCHAPVAPSLSAPEYLLKTPEVKPARVRVARVASLPL
jgi:hypothetical protein